MGLEAVHLGQDLVEGLLALITAATEASTPGAPHAIQLVDEDDGRCSLPRGLKELANPGGADSHEDLDKLGAGNGEGGHPRLAGQSLGKETSTLVHRILR